MYEELIKELRETSACFGELDSVSVMMLEAADAIEAMCEMVAIAHNELANVIQSYEESKPRWIPVTDQLPEKHKYVLVRYKNNDMAVAYWFDEDEDILFWRAMTDEGWCADCDSEPTHWMPLPEPPKEETE